jgi:hypothetical protein
MNETRKRIPHMNYPLLPSLLIVAGSTALTLGAASAVGLVFSSWGKRWEFHLAEHRRECWKRDVLAAWRR